ncbi:type II secretion system F family protein [Agrobacterium sp. 22117]|uniref:type II secretion system F family protein n=1 Tax=Agrobacterium sp. 22117 TaxID=3453880 RepID=UPI003F82F9B0
MTSFAYTVFDQDGSRIKGSVDAVDLGEATRKLKAKGLLVESVSPISIGATRHRLDLSQALLSKFNLTRFFADLAILMNAGLGIDQSLRAMHEASTRITEKRLIGDILEQLSSGKTAADSLACLSEMPEDVVALIASGERSARLAHVVKVIAADFEKRDAQKKRLVDAAVYPCFLLVMLVIAIGIVTFVLVPTLEPIFESSGRDMPLIVVLLSAVRRSFMDPWALLTLVAISLTIFLAALLNPVARKRTIAAALLRMPLLGKAIRGAALARYLQSLGLMLENSVPLPEAVNLSARCSPVASLRVRLLEAHEVLVSGKRLSEALLSTGLFPRPILALVTIGEGVNKLPTVLENASGILQTDSQRLTDRLLALMTPVITILLGLIVGGLIVSVMTALLGVNELGLQ